MYRLGMVGELDNYRLESRPMSEVRGGTKIAGERARSAGVAAAWQ